ncbi:glycosyltransferase [uncultured Psychrobacter sp.]|uniref:glycosyltransferase family 2 protein n=1 Tax=uncultured Psychrobacter sp. TaxID=259303 RepID=UPI002634B75C|nr:glycosyltransferase [uncultured Psychrobacter sp.]
MKFSVVIPLYNKANHIQRAIDSVLNQSIQDFECIVVNDGSTDDSEQLVKNYNNKCVRLINQKNGGEAAARNRGIKEAKGDFIAFLDADDEWEVEFLNIISGLIATYPNAGVFATALKVKERNGQLNTYYYKNLPPHPWNGIIPSYFECLSHGAYPLSSSSTCIKKELLSNIGSFDSSLKIGADIDMWVRVALNTEIAFSSTVGAVYYRDAENRSDKIIDFTERELFFLHNLEKYSSYPGMADNFLTSLNNFRAKKLKSIIIRYLINGQRLRAAKVFLRNNNLFKDKDKAYLLLRLLLPNTLVNVIKKKNNK